MMNLSFVRYASKLVVASLALTWFCSLTIAQDESDSGKAEVSAELEVKADEHAKSSDDHKGAGKDHSLMPFDDPNHANMSPAAYEVVDWRTDLAFFTAIVFLALMTLLATTAWGPISKALEKRELSIANNIKQAEEAAQTAKSKLAEYEAKLSSAVAEAQQIVAEARKDAEVAGQKLITAAQEEAGRQRERAVSEIEMAKRQAMGEMARQSTDIAISLAQRVVGREVKAQDHQGLIQDMLSKLPSSN